MSLIKRIFKLNKDIEIDYKTLPAHIAVIMDGNGRWAKKRGLPRSVGHREGASKLKKITKFCGEIGIKYLTVYAFSTENWKRPKSEVDTLMGLLTEFLRNAERELDGANVSIRVIGNITGLSDEIQKEIQRVTRLTEDNDGLVLNIALNYGSRDEMICAVKGILRDFREGKLQLDDINEDIISDYLYTAGIPDPDLLIRTSGEKRVSNFLLWQVAYSEFWYTDVLWPDFDTDDLKEAISVYQKRNRRFGGI